MLDLGTLVADPDFYAPLVSADPGTVFVPAAMPAGWRMLRSGVWTAWRTDDDTPAHGWKIHVSAAASNAQLVLDIVAAACVDLGISFKHVAGHKYFLIMHHKHGSRVQSGKFCTLYPPTASSAREAMERLERDLAGVDGPYVLTDRRFGASRCVSYRYGAFVSRFRLEADGSRTPTLLTTEGAETVDDRRPCFILPPGVDDPFAVAQQDEVSDGPAHFNGYVFESVLQHSNAGGSYRATASNGAHVFVKEARAHNGYTDIGTDAKDRLEREFLVLRAVHASAPGLCPAPIEYFSYWENSYLVTELVPGITLQKWAAASSPLIQVSPSSEEITEYYRRCATILEMLRVIIRRLHRLGFVFGDLSPRNVLVDDHDQPRLIDFESTIRIGEPVTPMGTPGFVPPQANEGQAHTPVDPRHLDNYALASIALALLAPLHHVADRNPAALAHLRADLTELAPLPSTLWSAATEWRRQQPTAPMPTPEEVRSDHGKWLRWLRDATADALEAMALSGHGDAVYPTTPEGHRTNMRCVAHGTAGVLHALRIAGRDTDPAVVSRLRDESLQSADETPPGLLYGSAGIAWVLADLGQVEAAQELLQLATEHRLTHETPGLGGGGAGVALAHLALHCRTGEYRHIDEAERIMTALRDHQLAEVLDSTSGWAQGASGVALVLHYLERLTGKPQYRRYGLDLLRAEVARHGQAMPGDALSFRISRRDNRAVPYLQSGSAGFGHVLARYLVVEDDPELAATFAGCLRALTIRITALPGLLRGLAGMSLVLGDIADTCGRPDLLASERIAATGLFRYAVPHRTGIRWLGDLGLRFSADLATGSAGILLALTRLVDRVPDPLFTLDSYSSTRSQSSPGAGPRADEVDAAIAQLRPTPMDNAARLA